jgi:hypothetical protein
MQKLFVLNVSSAHHFLFQGFIVVPSASVSFDLRSRWAIGTSAGLRRTCVGSVTAHVENCCSM